MNKKKSYKTMLAAAAFSAILAMSGLSADEHENCNDWQEPAEVKQYCNWEPQYSMQDCCPDWCGPYAGFHFGYGWDVSSSSCCDKGDLEGFVAGLHAGWNFNYCSFVYGAEVDGSWSQIEGPACCYRRELEWLASIRGRIGMGFGCFFPYATAGAAFGKVSPKIEIPIPKLDPKSETYSGYVFGGGFEYWTCMSNCMTTTTRIEVLYYDLGESDNLHEGDIETLVVRGAVSFNF